VGKPGPGSISEAIQQQLPVIVVRNAWTMPQERYNTEWIEENAAGLVLDSFSNVGDAVQVLTAKLGEYRANVARIQNRAVFEIPVILEGIMQSESEQPQRFPDGQYRRPPRPARTSLSPMP